MNNFDRFYPISNTMRRGSPFWQIGMVAKLEGHLQMAKTGNRESESKLCNRLGQLRRNVAFDSLVPDLKELIDESVKFLRSKGRKVNFKQEDPALWITQRDGSPRW